MIRQKSSAARPLIVDLTGPDGNAFVLLSMAKRWARDLSLDYKSIQADAMAGDYEHLLSVMDKHFGEHVIFER
jgi:hypothetical protein